MVGGEARRRERQLANDAKRRHLHPGRRRRRGSRGRVVLLPESRRALQQGILLLDALLSLSGKAPGLLF